jgi:hypothetical protein
MSAAMTMKIVRYLSFSAVVLLAACAWAQDAPPDTSAAHALDAIPPAPATDLDARDYIAESDAGDKIAVTWALSPDDGGGMNDVLSYQLWRSGGAEAEWDSLGTAAAGETRYLDESAEPGVDYYYGIAAFDGTNYSERASFGPVAGRANFFQDSRTSVLVLMAVFFGMVLYFTKLAERGAKLFVRRIPGLNAIEEAVGRATEMGRPVLYVPGIGEIDNIMTIASLTILSHVAKITARYDTPLIVPTARAVVMSAAEEVVKEAYAEVGKPDSYNPDNIRYLSDAQFAFAGAVNGIMLREKPAANLYMGAFWAESLLLAETGFEAGAIQVAGTAMVSQLPFFVTACDFTLMGEELYAASAYLSREPKLLGGLKGSDWMKVLSIMLMTVGVILYMLNPDNAFVTWFTSQ